MRYPVLFIGGSDPSGGAGIQADIKTCQALDGYAMALPTALTVQSSQGVQALELLPPSLVAAQLRAVLADIPPLAIKVGMLGSPAIAQAVAAELEAWQGQAPLVLDPVLSASSGLRLGALEAIAALLPHCSLLTPNLPEAGALLAQSLEPKALLEGLKASLPCAFLLKGGHGQGALLTDWLWDGKRLSSLTARRQPDGQLHGTGCTLAAAIATELAKGKPLAMAVLLAHQYLQGAIARAARAPLGKGPHGPLWH
ncbi:bifunctional hydroxymethylpyrimidine kinase/phosphomethylpyrimidine kinase [Gallaecimonas kandeliae]|uniref:bifunctional hydroxymethylpyrimidine kinase/phosphomethylpyrimidine kinase n=1 Tax=Gallaecimonas kandeliae TaxID=3029055 RepID=UPI002648B8A5|nr:bifunctional hydroxymethylpyrimidine kinase/phosphomethylpyrimidine kinase [Gallaecimonas kandeliae]WKE66943.1 bifunctional hydroxymethylpyrimidine kinase/phosphomethylpyrimidine kinase [Gallaecimonas kandeliae]